MSRNDTYFIPYLDKFIIYQPLNKFAFIGNRSMVDFITEIFDSGSVDKADHLEAMTFLNAYGFFNSFQPAEQSGNGGYKPTVCVLCLTSACNFNCTYCFANGGEGVHREMALETGKKAIDIVAKNAAHLNKKEFVLSFHGGGEPSLPFQKLKAFCSYTRRKKANCTVELTSNGYWSKEKTRWIISNINNLTLSFDGIEDIQNKQRPLKNGEKSFEVVMHNISELDKSGMTYGIRITVGRESVTRLAESVSFLCSNTSCTTFQVEPAFAAGRALNNDMTIENNALFVDQFLQAYDIASKNERHLYYSGARPWVNTNCFCTAHDKALVVTPEGLLSSCYEISGAEHPLARVFHFGTLTKEKGLDIDFSIRHQFEKKIEERKELCRSCFNYWHCAGDCPAKTFRPGSMENNLFNGRCDVNREITLKLLLRKMELNDGIYKE